MHVELDQTPAAGLASGELAERLRAAYVERRLVAGRSQLLRDGGERSAASRSSASA
ncbi:MAG TPA: hypothetical protein VGE38_14005 [Nocardioides sp.]|uniref:hypothetical protein n=1 Tax=Nocardioides sp. TaxID=35761 RepID=UPI002ED982A5